MGKLELTRVGDTVMRDGTDYTQREILSYFDEHFETTDSGDYLTSGGGVLKRAHAAKSWRQIIGAIPDAIPEAARGARTTIEEEGWRYGPHAMKFMHAMGWRGGGLGPNELDSSTYIFG